MLAPGPRLQGEESKATKSASSNERYAWRLISLNVRMNYTSFSISSRSLLRFPFYMIGLYIGFVQ